MHRVAVYDGEFFVVLPAGHRLARAAEVPFAALASDQWVVSSAAGTCPDTRVFHQACRRAGFTPSVTFRAEDYTTVQGLAAANIGASLVPSLAVPGTRGMSRYAGWPGSIPCAASRWQPPVNPRRIGSGGAGFVSANRGFTARDRPGLQRSCTPLQRRLIPHLPAIRCGMPFGGSVNLPPDERTSCT